MKRNATELSRREYDLLVIGGGVYGVCTAWDAALRGLSVALVEKGDFGHATSFNTLRVIHGGLRYLQHGDIRRLRQSIFERSTFMRIAPHLVHPLPFLIPTYGHLMRGKEIFSLALLLNHVVGFNLNDVEDPQKQLPPGRVIPRQECLRLFPGVDERGLTGAIITYDAQMYNSERLVLSVARSAAEAGAEMANYLEVFGLLQKGDRVAGVKARDLLSGNEVDVRARALVNTSGPWLNQISGLLNGRQPCRKLIFSKAFNLLVNRPTASQYAIGVYSNGRFNDRDAVLNKGSRLFFITPWHHQSLIGTVHLPYDADPDRVSVTAREAQVFLDELNKACPAVDLRRSEVSFAYAGLLPVSDFSASEPQLLKRYQIYDHQREDGVRGLISVTGVKFTEARHVAERTVDLVFRRLGRIPPKPATAVTPVHGGDIERFQTFLSQETARCPRGLSTEAIQKLIYRYGSAYSEVLQYLDDGRESDLVTSAAFPSLNAICNKPVSPLINAEIRYSMRQEMAQKLADVIFRRTELGLAGNPGEACLKDCARIMSKELGWNATRTQNEINSVGSILARRALSQ
jgi:glycerol-3-phosphate dehydrogenase